MCHSFHQRAVVGDNGAAKVVELSCKMWCCQECGPKNAERWMARFREFARSADAFEVESCSTKYEYLALQARLRRNGCPWISVRSGGQYRVFHVRFTGNRQTAAKREQWISPREMLLAAKQAISSIDHRHGSKPVSVSDDVPKPEGWSRRKSGGILYARTSVTVKEMNRRLALVGCCHQILLGKKFAADLLPSICGDGLSLTVSCVFSKENHQRSVQMSERDWWPKTGVRSMETVGPPGG